MFNNIGSKIKTLATATTVIGIIASVLTGIILISTDEELIGLGLLIMIVGSLIFWISSFITYGFGELIENTGTLISLQRAVLDNSQSSHSAPSSFATQKKKEQVPETAVLDNSQSSHSGPSSFATQKKKEQVPETAIERWKNYGLLSEEEYNNLIKKSEE